MEESLTGSASGLDCPRPGSTEYRIKVSTDASGTHRDNLLLWQSSGYGYQDRMGGLLEEPSNPKEEITRKPKGRQGNDGAKRTR